MTIDRDVLTIQRAYPQVYLACHVDHVRAASTPHQLSARDSSILAHVDRANPTTPRDLARHLGIAPSTLSAALGTLTRLGYVRRTTDPADRRTVRLTLSPKGEGAMSATSVLDATRVVALLDTLTPSERQGALDGLTILADGARRLRRIVDSTEGKP